MYVYLLIRRQDGLFDYPVKTFKSGIKLQEYVKENKKYLDSNEQFCSQTIEYDDCD